MGWCLSYLPLKEQELLDEFFLIVGKALYLATSYEAKCKYLLNLMRLTDYVAQGGKLTATAAVADLVKAKLLGPTIVEMKAFPDFKPTEVAALERAKEARNYIAHQAADVGRPLSSVSAKHVHLQFEKLRTEIGALVEGDNIISNWIFGIENWKESSCGMRNAYPGLVRQWLYGSEPSVEEEK